MSANQEERLRDGGGSALRDERRRPKPCRGCIYAGWTSSGDACCDYILIVGRRRPCPPGKECTVKRAAKQAINWEAAREAYDGGALDREIAKAAGCSIATVRLWREREGLESNYFKRAREKR